MEEYTIRSWQAERRLPETNYARAQRLLRGRLIVDKLTGQEVPKLQFILSNSIEVVSSVANGSHQRFKVKDKEGWEDGNLILNP